MDTRATGTVLTVAGPKEFTAANAGLFRKQVGAALNGHSVVEVDLSQTTAMDCAGLGALIAVRNWSLRRNGAVRLVGTTPVVQRLFEIVRAGDLFDTVEPHPGTEPWNDLNADKEAELQPIGTA